MTGFILRRLLAAVGVLWAMTLVIFAIVHILPGNVAYAILGEYATPRCGPSAASRPMVWLDRRAPISIAR